MYLQNLKEKEKLSVMVNTPLQVEGVSYNFDQYIENEWVSHFREYSHRMRSNFLKGAKIFDGLVTEIQDGVAKMEKGIYEELGEFESKLNRDLQNKEREINETLEKKTKELTKIINSKKATDTTVGLVSKNEIRTLVTETIPKATLEEIWEAI